MQVDAGELKFEILAATELAASLSETTNGVVNPQRGEAATFDPHLDRPAGAGTNRPEVPVGAARVRDLRRLRKARRRVGTRGFGRIPAGLA